LCFEASSFAGWAKAVPFKRLEKAGKYRKKRWELKDGWLILEAF